MMATKIVGLDLGTHSVKVSELVSTFRSVELVAFGSEPVGVEGDAPVSVAELAAAARRLLERRGLLDETIICALPPELVSTVTLEFPFDQPKKLQAVMAPQLDDVIPFDVDDVVHDYQIIERRPDGGSKVLVSYAKTESVRGFIEALAAQGIDPKVVGVGPLAWYNLHDHIITPGAGPVAVLDLGHRHSEMCVFDGGQPVRIRQVPVGGREVTRALAQVFKVAHDQAERGKLAEGVVLPDGAPGDQGRQQLISDTCKEALAPVLRELRRTLAAHDQATERPVERVLLTGGTSLLRGLPEWLGTSLGLPVELIDPRTLPFYKLADRSDRLQPFIAHSLSLALRGSQRTHHSMMDFRKGEFAYTGDFSFLRGRIISVAVSVVMIIVLAAMVAVSRKRVLEAEHQTLLNQTRALSMEVLGYESDDADLLFATITSQVKQDASIPETSAFETLKELSEKIGFDLKVDVDVLEIDLSRRKLQMQGKTEGAAEAERLVDVLRQTRCFNSKVNKERVEKTMDEKTKFRLSANSNCI